MFYEDNFERFLRFNNKFNYLKTSWKNVGTFYKKGKPAFIPKALFTTSGRSSDLLPDSCRLPEIVDYQWRSGKH